MMEAANDSGNSSNRDPPNRRQRVSKGHSYHGCITCRARKVKCDETKPTCTRCRTARFTCDGYSSNFRTVMVTSTSLVPAVASTPARTPMYYQPLLEEVLYLARHFTIQPVPSHSTTYEKEARATLEAASEPAIKHALASLNALRRLHAEKRSGPAGDEHMPGPLQHGIKEYTSALGALATRLANHDAAASKAALLCCQLFISIETALNNFTSSVQHFLRGLQIMHQYGGRCSRSPDRTAGMPNVDIFTIKMFMSCPDRLFSFRPEELDKTETGEGTATATAAPILYGTADPSVPDPCQQPMLQARKQLALIAISAIDLLEQSLKPVSAQSMIGIQAEQLQLLDRLGRWRGLFEPLRSIGGEGASLKTRLAALFTTLFYLLLKSSVAMAFHRPVLHVDVLKADFAEMMWVAKALTNLKSM